ncbi:hypothetical protein KsCSTR_07150 [Candidatus Kuenenia stuttgartiensis]|uniref:Uncharacterized protein n=1 Tax=Kuenenia stuttgartiensis TaxID=174633 RepID=A0A6G7GL66_KUEST|nr:hypothetical protein KsCSTR_07150 [Candidatus Kuenenia stuttgartiensis]
MPLFCCALCSIIHLVPMGRQGKTPAATEYKKLAVSYRGHDIN